MIGFTAVGMTMLVGLTQATEFTTDSVVGRSIMQKAKTVRASKFIPRGLQDNNNQWAYSGLSSMTIKYIGCSTYNSYAAGEGNNGGQYNNGQYNGQQQQQQQGGGQGNNNGAQGGDQYWYYQNMAQNDGLQASNLVRFTLCKDSGCSGNCDGEYVLDMAEFMETYTEWKMDHDSFWCERVRERCICNGNGNNNNGNNGNGNGNNGNNNYGYTWAECYSSCYEQSPYGLTYEGCIEANAEEGGENVFQIQQYLECNGIEFYNPNNAYQNYQQNGGGNQNFNWNNFYYLGLTCDNNANVVLKAFYDEECSYRASDDEVKDAMGSYTKISYLQGTPVLAKNTCITCISDDDQAEMEDQQYQNANQAAQYNYNNANAYNYNNGNNNNNWEDQPDANDVCSMITNQEGDGNVIVCDESRYQTSGCAWIKNTLPSLDGRFHFDYSEQLSKLKQQLEKSERMQWALLGIVLVLIGSISIWIGSRCCRSRNTVDDDGADRRDRLLQWRKDNPPASTSDLA